MYIRKPSDIKPSEITDREVYRQRRRFLGLAGASAAGIAAAAALPGLLSASRQAHAQARLAVAYQSPFNTKEALTPYKDVTTYNNFYEFGVGKSDPAELAASLKPHPWTVTIDGACARPGSYHLEDFIKPHALGDYVYRHRCVEAWSMVIPWVGFPLAEVIKRAGPTAAAKYVQFTTLLDPRMFPGQRLPVLDWPYTEGLRMDEAMHPLTLFAVGLYGEVLPNQNGAPLRLVVPWKYGFKSIKSIVRISFVERQPITTWMRAVPSRYGFYSNVNPDVDRVPWSQRYERRIGDLFKRKTLMFNGYGSQVAQLYAGMDLSKYY